MVVSDVKSRWRNWDYLFDGVSKDIHKMYDLYVLLFLDYLIIISLGQIYMNGMEFFFNDLYGILINIILNYQCRLNRKLKDRYDKK